MTSGDPAQPPRRVDRAGIVIAAVLAVLAAGLVCDTRGLQTTTMYGMGPEVMPVVVASGLALLAIGNFIDAVRGNLPARESTDPVPVFLILVGLALLIAIIGFGGGFILATSALFVTTSAAFGRRAILVDSIIAVVMSTLIYLPSHPLLTPRTTPGPLA